MSWRSREFWILPKLSALLPLSLSPSTSEPQNCAWGNLRGVSQSGAAFQAGSFPCSRSHVGKGWDKWIGAAWWDTASQPGLCLRLTSGLPQAVETMVATFRAQLGNQTWPTAPNPPTAPSDSQINTHLQYVSGNTSVFCFVLCPASGWVTGTILSMSGHLPFWYFLSHLSPFFRRFQFSSLRFADSGSQRQPSVTDYLTWRRFTVSQPLACGQVCWSMT